MHERRDGRLDLRERTPFASPVLLLYTYDGLDKELTGGDLRGRLCDGGPHLANIVFVKGGECENNVDGHRQTLSGSRWISKYATRHYGSKLRRWQHDRSHCTA